MMTASSPAPRFPARIPYASLIAGGLILLYIAFFFSQALLRHLAFDSSGFDLGIYDQVVWNTLHGRIYFYTTTGQPLLHLSNHADPSLIFVAPFYLVHSGPETLLFLQSAVIGLGGLPIFWLSRDRLKSDFAALTLLTAYLLFPALQIVHTWDFHPPALATGLLLYAFYFMVKRRYGWFMLFAFVAMGMKEQIPLVVIFMGLYLLLIERNWRVALPVIGIAVTYFVVMMYWIIPANSVAGEHIFLGYYADLGDSPAEIIVTTLTRPDLVLPKILQPAKLAYLRDILLPFGFLPLLGLPVFAIAAPSLGINLLSANTAMSDASGAQYITTIAPWLALGAIYGLDYLTRGLHRLLPKIATIHWVHGFSLALLLTTLSWQVWHGYSPLALDRPRWEITPHDQLAQRFLAQIPADAPIAAQTKLYPHLSNRIWAYQLPDVNDAEYAFFDVTTATWPVHPNDMQATYNALIASGEWGILDAADGYILLQRGLSQTKLPAEFYSFAQATTPVQPQYPLDVVFDGKIKLLGYDLIDDPRKAETSVRLYWQPLQSLDPALRLYPFFINGQNQVIEDTNLRPMMTQLWYPSELWPTDQVLISQTMPWPLGERWSLGVGVLQGDDWRDWSQRLPISNNPNAGRLFDAGTWLRAGTFTRQDRHLQVVPPAMANAPQHQLAANFGDQVTLLGYDTRRDDDTLLVTLHWTAPQPVPRDYSVFVHLLDSDGVMQSQHDGQPGGEVVAPMTTWQPGETVLDPHHIPLPPDLPAGDYMLNVGVYYWEDGERLPVLVDQVAVDNLVAFPVTVTP